MPQAPSLLFLLLSSHGIFGPIYVAAYLSMIFYGPISSSDIHIPCISEIIEEMMTIRISERSTRIIDHDTEGSMEIKKRDGYF